MGQIHVFPLGSWMTRQCARFKSYQFLKVVSGVLCGQLPHFERDPCLDCTRCAMQLIEWQGCPPCTLVVTKSNV